MRLLRTGGGKMDLHECVFPYAFVNTSVRETCIMRSFNILMLDKKTQGG
jgi:hypothetical protein